MSDSGCPCPSNSFHSRSIPILARLVPQWRPCKGPWQGSVTSWHSLSLLFYCKGRRLFGFTGKSITAVISNDDVETPSSSCFFLAEHQAIEAGQRALEQLCVCFESAAFCLFCPNPESRPLCLHKWKCHVIVFLGCSECVPLFVFKTGIVWELWIFTLFAINREVCKQNQLFSTLRKYTWKESL